MTIRIETQCSNCTFPMAVILKYEPVNDTIWLVTFQVCRKCNFFIKTERPLTDEEWRELMAP